MTGRVPLTGAERSRRYRRKKKRNAIASDERNLRLVASIARRVHAKLPPSFDLDDLIATGHVALIRAAERYDPAAHNDTPFSAYVRRSIRGAILDSVRRNKYIENTRESIDDPGPGTVHDGDRDRDTSSQFQTAAQRGLARMATRPPLDQSIDQRRLVDRVSDAISWLPSRERRLLEAWYAADEPTLRDVARRLRIRQEDAVTLHASAIATLQALLSPGAARPRPEAGLRKAA